MRPHPGRCSPGTAIVRQTGDAGGATLMPILSSPILLVLLVLVVIITGFNVLREYERAVIFRWGRLARGVVGGNGPGVVVIIPFIDKLVRVSLRTVAMDVPP